MQGEQPGTGCAQMVVTSFGGVSTESLPVVRRKVSSPPAAVATRSGLETSTVR
jgi:hypothetical protein